jgi:hypothetical protein
MTPRSCWNIGRSTTILVAMILALVAPVMAQEASDLDEVTVVLEEVADSGIIGVAMLTADGEQTDVAIRLTGARGDHPNHIHENFCDNVNPEPRFPLTHIEVGNTDPDGFTNSTVDVSLEELLTGEYSILVHLSDDQLDEYLVCGNIGTAPDQAAEVATEPPVEVAAVTVGEPTEVAAVQATEVAPEASAPEERAATTTVAAVEPTGVAAANVRDAGAVNEISTSGVGSAAETRSSLLVLTLCLAVIAAGVAIESARQQRLGRRD